MSTLDSQNSQGPLQGLAPGTGSATLCGALIGLVPLGLLALIIAVALALAVLARQLTAASGFFAQQQAALIILIAGFVLALVVYVVAIVLTTRRIAAWQQNGIAVQARAALWSLGITALIVILPFLLAILLPQHPAP
ncbi:MAG: hypothetical protein ACJ8CB_31915 [Ktedonobacteraceae bacterium]